MPLSELNTALVSFTGAIDSFMYTYILVILLVFAGVYFSVRTGFVQLRFIKDMFKNIVEKKADKNGKSISSFQAMMVSTASRVGTGNIAGVAGAIAIGGPGAVFWMWCSALLGMCTKFAEVTLAVYYRERSETGEWVGGPMYYIKNGLSKHWQSACR